ncbi:hypothetical protein BDV95DRAFT_599167 [Massariosphaeria phaeospora]|uniref:Uncharacterized protein n=1 Tax=Massariosphaeria phaeospora TaxID=100035 RepID=A0A7C8I3N2_9PLEO|nr:hypothetical protein BDV95DRAFT_599167 [Massariosphaeria phaeospora]
MEQHKSVRFEPFETQVEYIPYGMGTWDNEQKAYTPSTQEVEMADFLTEQAFAEIAALEKAEAEAARAIHRKPVPQRIGTPTPKKTGYFIQQRRNLEVDGDSTSGTPKFGDFLPASQMTTWKQLDDHRVVRSHKSFVSIASSSKTVMSMKSWSKKTAKKMAEKATS